MFTKRQLTIDLTETLGRVLLAVITASAVIYLLSGRIAAIGQTAKENRTAVTILEGRSQVGNDLKNNFASIGDGDKKVEGAFVEAENITEFINKLENIARDVGLEQNLKFYALTPLQTSLEKTGENKPAEELKLMSVDYNINLKGDAASFARYIGEFEKLPYFSKITSVTINSSPAVGWEKEAAISISARLYLRQ